MVTVSMASEIAKVDPGSRYREVLRECLVASKAFYDPRRRIFLEYQPADTPEGRLFCPGDSIEASWFLLHAAPDEEMRGLLLDSIEGALEFGWDQEYGGLYYFMDVEGLPPLPLESNMKLWWPHTEAIYATVLAHSLTRDPKWLGVARTNRYLRLRSFLRSKARRMVRLLRPARRSNQHRERQQL